MVALLLPPGNAVLTCPSHRVPLSPRSKSTTFCLGVSFGLTMATRFLPRPPGLILSSLLFTTLSVGLTTSNGVRVLAKEMNKGLVMDESPVAHSFRVLIKSLDVPEAVGKLSPEAQAKIRAAEVHMRPDGLPDLTPPDRLLARMTYRQDATGMMDAVDTEAERKLARHAAGMRDADPALVRDEAMPRDEPMPADEAMPTFVDRPASSGKGVRRNKYGDIVEDD